MRTRLLILCGWLMGLAAPLWAARLYVDKTAGGANTGGSWPDAYWELTNALAKANNDDEIWVAQGTYYPGTARTDSFILADQRLQIYGGFTNGMTSLSDRNWTNHLTILDGDVQQDAVRDNNAYHVVKGNWYCRLDGFVVRNGYANLSGEETYGGGIYLSWSPMQIRNCRIENNYALKYGGGAYVVNNVSVFTACEFLNNQSGSEGGGITCSGNFTNGIFGCRFAGNTAGSHAGAIYCFNNPTWIQQCTFITNRAAQNGGAIYHNSASATGVVEQSSFLGNMAGAQGGGGAYVSDLTPTYRNCLFVGNQAVNGGGYYATLKGGTVSNCLFLANQANSGGGGAFLAVMTDLRDCAFIGNAATNGGSGGAVSLSDKTRATLAHCLFAGNQAADVGGAINGSFATYTNASCTFRGNRAGNKGGTLAGYSSKPTIVNSIFWNNSAPSAAEWYLSGDTVNKSIYTVRFSDIEGGWNGSRISAVSGSYVTNDGGNIALDPLFAPPQDGTWTGDGVFNEAVFQTLLTDANQAWGAGALAGMTLNPDLAQYREFLVVTNDATRIIVWGDCAGLATNKGGYRIFDAHLQSANGRWTPAGWVSGPGHSPCIDQGDPGTGFDREPRPNGGRVNMGVFGNTAQASRSRSPGSLLLVR